MGEEWKEGQKKENKLNSKCGLFCFDHAHKQVWAARVMLCAKKEELPNFLS